MLRKRVLPIGLLTLFAGTCAATTHSIQLTGVNFLAACASNGCGGSFQGMMDGISSAGKLSGGTVVTLFCVDYQNSTHIPSAIYQTNVSAISVGSDLSNTRYGRSVAKFDSTSPLLPISFKTASFNETSGVSFLPSALQRYQMAGWLTQQYSSAATASVRNAIQSAIWQIMDIKAPAGKTASIVPVIQGSAAWLTSAATFVDAHFNDAYFNQFRVVTQTAPVYLARQSPAQEYMMVTPEPAVWVLFGTTAVLLVGTRRKRRGTQNQIPSFSSQ